VAQYGSVYYHRPWAENWFGFVKCVLLISPADLGSISRWTGICQISRWSLEGGGLEKQGVYG